MIKSAKKRRKKKILQNNNIVPQKHERIGNLNYYSEEIAKEIIDKLISLTFTKLFSKKLDEKVSSYTIDLVNKTINNYLQLAFINYDKDDLYFSNNEMIKKKYFNSDEKRFKYKRRIKFNTRKKLLAELDLKNISNDRRKEIILKNKKISDFLSSSFEQPINNLSILSREEVFIFPKLIFSKFEHDESIEDIDVTLEVSKFDRSISKIFCSL